MQENHTRSDLKAVAPGPLDKSGLCLMAEVDGIPRVVAAGIKNPGDARRLAACWNSCAGVETDLLEQYPAPFSDLRRQRDDALTAAATGKRQLLEEMDRASTRGEQMLAAEQQRDTLLEALRMIHDGEGMTASELMGAAGCAVEDYEDDAKARRLGVRGGGQWLPVTPQLLNSMDAGDYGARPWFWIACKHGSTPIACYYQWLEGRNPHHFLTADGKCYNAVGVTHVMPYTPPALPKP